MRNKKRVTAQFTFHDRTGIQNYLERMAEKGWMLEKCTKWSWHFRRIEPKKIHFAVSYFAKTSSFQPSPPEELLRFREFCEHTGWHFCAEAAQMQIFYNEAPDPVPIETDALLEIESIHKGVKKQVLPSFIALAAVAVLNGATQISDFLKFPIVFLRSNLNLFVMLSILCLFLTVAVEIFSYFIWRARALKAARCDGSFIPTRGNRTFIFILLYILLAAFALLIISEWNGFISKAFLIGMGYYLALLLLVHGISDIMKRKKVEAATNVTVTIILAFVLSFAMIGVLTWTLTKLEDISPVEETEEEYVLAPDEEYTSDTGRTYTAQHHSLPIYAAELYDHEVPDNVYSDFHYVEESIVLTNHECGSRVRYDYDNSWPNFDYENLIYNITDLKVSFLRDHIINHLLIKYEHKRYDGRYEYRAIDTELWGADEAWQMYGTDYIGGKKNPMQNYVIRWGDRILELHLPSVPNDDDIRLIAERLAP